MCKNWFESIFLAQLAQIRKSSLSRILCDTVGGLQFVQARVFETVSDAT